MTVLCETQLPESFSIQYDTHDRDGVRHWLIQLNHVGLPNIQWAISYYMNGHLKMMEWSVEKIARTYHRWAIDNQVYKFGMSCKNVRLNIPNGIDWTTCDTN
jgi:hypothetical protein